MALEACLERSFYTPTLRIHHRSTDHSLTSPDKMAAWTPTSWRGKPSQQMAEYEDKEAAAAVFAKLGKLPPLVQPAEVDRLRTVLAAAANGERFIVQGGDCAERFVDCEADRLEAQLKLLLQMGAIVAQSTVAQSTLTLTLTLTITLAQSTSSRRAH